MKTLSTRILAATLGSLWALTAGAVSVVEIPTQNAKPAPAANIPSSTPTTATAPSRGFDYSRFTFVGQLSNVEQPEGRLDFVETSFMVGKDSRFYDARGLPMKIEELEPEVWLGITVTERLDRQFNAPFVREARIVPPRPEE